jgi:phage tail tape-measure protein
MSELIIKKTVANEQDLNRDPITGTPGAHPLGTGAGAASGAVAGAVVGTVLGPVGAVIGAAVGAVAGGLAGKSAAEAVNPTAEELFWRETYVREPYYVAGRAYEYYAPGFRAGWEGRVRLDGRSFDEAEGDLKAAYALSKSELDPQWQELRPAARAAWDRVDAGYRTPARTA